MYRSHFKRVVDFILAFAALIALSPLLFGITLTLSIINKGKPFFFQRRPGWNEQPFKLVKFKTMTDETDAEGNLLANHLRITRFGAFLRKYSLDELPQLLNVLKGEMSLVGPRPLLFKYIDLYSPEQRRRHLVRPGVTGWAQVNGRNAITWKKKFEMDVYYVDHVSPMLDVKIFFRTILKVVKPEGVNAAENVTMPPFDGTN